MIRANFKNNIHTAVTQIKQMEEKELLGIERENKEAFAWSPRTSIIDIC